MARSWMKKKGMLVERTSDPRSYFYTRANEHNDYERDPELEKNPLFYRSPGRD